MEDARTFAAAEQRLEKASESFVREFWQAALATPIAWPEGEAVPALAGVVPRYRALTGFLLRAALRLGAVRSEGGRLHYVGPTLRPGLALAELDEARQALPDFEGEFTLLSTCLAAYGDVLAGRKDALGLLFPSGSPERLLKFYRDSPHSRLQTRLVTRALREHVDSLDTGRKVRILEIGAGTGATTWSVLSALGDTSRQIEYHYTDLAPSLLAYGRKERARQALAKGIDVKFALLDIEKAPAAQGYASEPFDVVIAAHVLHATRNLDVTLNHVREHLGRDGVAILVETCRPQLLWMTLVFGLTEGWWLFDGSDGREGTPLLDPEAWSERLQRVGFRDVGVLNAATGVEVQVTSRVIRAAVQGEVGRAKLAPAGVAQSAPNASMVRAVADYIRQSVAFVLEIGVDEVRADQGFQEMGLDSIYAQYLTGSLEEKLGVAVEPGLIFAHPTVRHLAMHLLRAYPERLAELFSSDGPEPLAPVAGEEPSTIEHGDGPPPNRSEPHPPRESYEVPGARTRSTASGIAVIGYSCRFPGARDADELWELLSHGRSAIADASHGLRRRRQPEGLFAASAGQAALLADIESFDNEFFQLSHEDATLLDPRARALLEESWSALEHAGISKARIAGKRVGVFFGLSREPYNELAVGAGLGKAAGRALGGANASAANRVSYFFDLRGPSLVIDAMCASSLAALHQACRALDGGDCELAIVGAASAALSEEYIAALAELGVLADGASCRPFQSHTKGFALGEGAAVLVLSPLARALEAGSPVHAVVSGSATAHYGAGAGFGVPNPSTARGLYSAAYQAAGITAADIDEVEAHGTGTPLGDQLELQGLADVLAPATERRRPVRISSLKAALGHGEAVSGLASLLKVVLELRHETSLPMLCDGEVMDPLRKGNLACSRSPERWPAGSPRRAGVSAFGMGGSGAHVVLEGPPPRERRKPERERTWHLLVLSARSSSALEQAIERLRDHLTREPHERVADLCYTLATGREHFGERVAVPCQSVSQVLEQLASGKALRGHRSASAASSPTPTVLAIGDVRVNAAFARVLLATHPGFRNIVMDALAALDAADQASVLHALTSEAGADERADVLYAFALARCLLGWGIGDAGVIDVGCRTDIVEALRRGEPLFRAASDPGHSSAARDAGRLVAALSQRSVRAIALGSLDGSASRLGVDFEVLDGAARDPWCAITELLGRLYVRGVAVDFERFDAEYARQTLPLPTYPFERRRCWVLDGRSERIPAVVSRSELAAVPPASRDGSASAPQSPTRVVSERLSEAARQLSYRVGWQALPSARAHLVPRRGTWIVFERGSAWSRALSPRPWARDVRWVSVQGGPRFGRTGADSFSVDITSAADYQRLLQQTGPIAGVIHASSADPAESAVAEHIAELADAIETGVVALLALLQALLESQDAQELEFWLFTGDAEHTPARASLVGLVQVLAREEGVRAHAVAVDTASAGLGVAELVELAMAHPQPYGLVRDGQLHRQILQPDLAVTFDARDPSTQHGAVLFPGGAAGIGLELARDLVSRTNFDLVLIHRSEPGRYERTLAELRSMGGRVTYMMADVSSLPAMQDVAARVRETIGPIRGVIHSGGVLKDRMIRNCKASEFRDVFAPKIFGSWVLDRVTRDDDLEFFVLFSSIAALIAPPGQAAHCAANRFQDALVRWRRHTCGRTATAVNWGAWGETGSAAAPRYIESLSAKGILPMTTASAVEAFRAILAARPVQRLTARLDTGLLMAASERLPIKVLPADSDNTAPRPTMHGRPDMASIEDRIDGAIARALHATLPLDRDLGFVELGLTSRGAVETADALGTLFGVPVRATDFFQYPTIAKLAEHIASFECVRRGDWLRASAPTPGDVVRLEATTAAASPALGDGVDSSPPGVPAAASEAEPIADEDSVIAIVGVGCRLPGAASPEALWQMLRLGRSAIRHVPERRWDVARFSSQDGALNKSYSDRGGFLDAVDEFDAALFGISPAEAALIDPQQRLFLEVAWEAFEDAGFGPELREGSTTGVFVGASTSHYRERFDVYALERQGAAVEPAVMLGNSNAIIANRVSYHFDLKGPSVTLDTLCSASLVAVHLALESLRRGECEAALVGGVHLHLSPSALVLESQMGALSRAGESRAFDAGADGFVTGEGAVALLLKPLARAKADGDHIYAVLLGSATNHGGRASGLSVPSLSGQRALLERAYRSAGVDMGAVDYIEAHGTGTSLGDPIELAALERAFHSNARKSFGVCGLGSLKTNVGHLEAAAGVAGLLKVVLALGHGELPPSLNFERPNPMLNLAASPFFIVDRLRPWSSTGRRRIAGVTALGMGGTNAHVVVGEYAQPSEARSPETARFAGPELLVLSAASNSALLELCARFAAHVAAGEGRCSLADLCLTANTGRTALKERVAFIAADWADLLAQLRAGPERSPAIRGRSAARRAALHVHLPHDTDGCASSFAELAERFPELSALRQRLLASALEAEPGVQARSKDPAVVELISQLALLQLLERWGIVADRLVAAGIGQVAADIHAGALALHDGMQRVGRASVSGAAGSPPQATSQGEVSNLYLGQRTPAQPSDWIVAAAPGRQAARALLTAVARLFVAGVPVRWSAVHGARGRRVSLPTYPFERQPYAAPLAPEAPRPIVEVSTRRPDISNGHSTPLNGAAQRDVGPTREAHHRRITEERVADELVKALRLPKEAVDREASFRDLGLDSLTGLSFLRSLVAGSGLRVQTDWLFKYPSVRSLSAYLDRALPSSAAHEPRPASTGANRVAVIGIACRLPGAASPDEFWHNLSDARCSTGTVPPERWNIDDYYSPDPTAPGKSTSKWGGWLGSISEFDPLTFRISPRDARLMDPQQRLMLEVASEALENAAHAGKSLKGSRTGVFIGATAGEYAELVKRRRHAIDASFGSGSEPSILANRVSYCFDLRGPSVVVDSACSSSLVALHWAMESLARGECEMALAGGVSLMVTPEKYVTLSKARLLSSDHRCKAFAEDADGYVRGEGAVALLLKPLDQAAADGDHIHAVLLGSAVNQDGRTNGISAPNPDAQVEVITRAWTRAAVDPASISLIEAHGTGTSLGDPLELRAIHGALSAHTGRRGFCAIGSVKSNIGHLEPAAGLAALLKVILSLRHRQIPATLHADVISRGLELEQTACYLSTTLHPWPTRGVLRAGVSSFGFGGTNCHVVVEEAAAPAVPQPDGDGPFVMALSARTASAVRELAKRLAAALGTSRHALGDVCYSLATGRQAFPVRVAVTGRSREELVQELRRAAERLPKPASSTRSTRIDVGAGEPARELRDQLVSWGISPDFIRGGGDVAPGEVIDLANAEPAIAAAKLWEAGFDVAWAAFYGARPHRRVPLPTYPFERERYWLDDEMGDAPAAVTAAAAAKGQCRAFEVGSRPLVVAGEPSTSIGGIWLVAGERGDPLLDALRSQLEPSVQRVHVVDADTSAAGWSASLRDGAAHSPRGVLWVAGEEAAATVPPELGERNYERRTGALLQLARAINERAHGLVQVYVVTRDARRSPLASAVRGLASVLGAELERAIDMHLIDFARMSTEDMARQMVVELALAEQGSDILYDEGRRAQRALLPVELPQGADVVRDGGTYLITGGAGGIGAEIALDIARRQRAQIALLGRAKQLGRPEIVGRLRELGSDAEYFSADVGSERELHAALAAVSARWGTIHGLIHAAGVIDPRPESLVSKKPDQLRATQVPKVRGVLNLAKALASQPPEFVVLMASLSGVAGGLGVGLGDYAAANAFLDGFARQQSQLGRTRWISIDWCEWRGTGMAAGRPEPAALADAGLVSLDPTSALDALWAAVAARSHTQLAILACDQGTFEPQRWLGPKRATRGRAAGEGKVAPWGGRAAQPRVALDRGRAAADVSLSAQALAEMLGAKLRINAADLDLHTPVGDYGIDSLVIADLFKAIEGRWGVRGNPALILEDPTLTELAERLREAAGGRRAPSRIVTSRDAARGPFWQPSNAAGEDGVDELGILDELARGAITEQEALGRLSSGGRA